MKKRHPIMGCYAGADLDTSNLLDYLTDLFALYKAEFRKDQLKEFVSQERDLCLEKSKPSSFFVYILSRGATWSKELFELSPHAFQCLEVEFLPPEDNNDSWFYFVSAVPERKVS